MKRVVLTGVLLAWWLGLVNAQTHFSVESQNLIVSESVTPIITTFMTHGFVNSRLGIFVWSFTNKYWAEAYAGPTYSPTSFIQAGIGSGLEQADGLWRVGGFIWIGNKKFQALTLLEKGTSGRWHRIIANYNLSKWLGIGGITERFLGTGPRIQFAVPHLPVQIWTAKLYLNNRWSNYLSMKFSF